MCMLLLCVNIQDFQESLFVFFGGEFLPLNDKGQCTNREEREGMTYKSLIEPETLLLYGIQCIKSASMTLLHLY